MIEASCPECGTAVTDHAKFGRWDARISGLPSHGPLAVCLSIDPPPYSCTCPSLIEERTAPRTAG